MIDKLHIGSCVKFFHGVIMMEAIVINIKDDIYTLWGISPSLDRFSEFEGTLADFDRLEKIENLHFFTLQELTLALISMKNEVKVMYAGESNFGNEKHMYFIVLKHGSKYFKIIIPCKDIKYIYMSMFRNEKVVGDFLNDLNFNYKDINKIVKPKPLNPDNFMEMVNASRVALKSRPEGIYGVYLEECVIYNFEDSFSQTYYGQGLKIKD